MKCLKCILKIAAALAAVAGVCYLISRYWDKICEKLQKCPCAGTPEEEPGQELEEKAEAEAPVNAEEAAPAAEEAEEEPAQAEETVTTEDFAD